MMISCSGLKLRLIVMWSVPFNLGVHSSYLAVGMVYNEGRSVENKEILTIFKTFSPDILDGHIFTVLCNFKRFLVQKYHNFHFHSPRYTVDFDDGHFFRTMGW